MNLPELYKQRSDIENKIRSIAEHGVLPIEWVHELGEVAFAIRQYENPLGLIDQVA